MSGITRSISDKIQPVQEDEKGFVKIKQGHDFKGRHENKQGGKHTILGDFTIESRLNECLRQEVVDLFSLACSTDEKRAGSPDGHLLVSKITKDLSWIQGCLTRKRPAL